MSLIWRWRGVLKGALAEASRGLFSTQVVGWSVRVLGLMAAVDAEAVRVCGGVRLVVRAMQSHQQDVGVVAEALSALLPLTGADPSTKDGERAQVAVIEAGGAAEVVGAMTRLAEHVEVQEQCSEVSK